MSIPVRVYGWFGGYGEFCTIMCLASAITLAFMGRLSGDFAAAITAIGGLGVIHDQLTDYQKSRNGNGHKDKD